MTRKTINVKGLGNLNRYLNKPIGDIWSFFRNSKDFVLVFCDFIPDDVPSNIRELFWERMPGRKLKIAGAGAAFVAADLLPFHSIGRGYDDL